MKKTIFFLSFIFFLLNSCDHYTGEFREVEKDNIAIMLPDWLEETKDLAPHAFYQFKSRYRNTYGIVVKNPKDGKSLQEYQKESLAVLRNFNELTNLLVTDSVYSTNKIQVELMGDLESEKIFYWHNTYEGKDNFYQLVVWTRSFDRKQKYTPVIEKVIESFEISE